ncbi:MAG: LamG domain-containing protein, partial [Pirellulales bacterium]|nr:LamG domain-containing protein [Pirellulales bacterium]
SGSGGAVYLYNGVLVLDHTIVAGNSDGLGEAPDIDSVNLTALPAILAKHSLIGNDEGSAITELEPNFIGTSATPIDPLLGMLDDNGGPTMTHKALAGSLAIDGGNVDILLPPDFDQRGPGFDRIAFGVIDIGALESNGFVETFTVDTLIDENDGDFTSGDLSLREAIMLSSNIAGKDLINFNPLLSGGTIALDAVLGELLVDAPMTIDASDLINGVTIDASTADPTPMTHDGDGSRVVRIDDGNALLDVEVVFAGITFTGGDVAGDGGGIYSLENLSLQYVSVVDNAATDDGGGIFHENAPLVIENSTIASNHADADGGGLYSDTSMNAPETGHVSQATFSGNAAGDEGGGIFNNDGLLEIKHSTITLNDAKFGGGVVSFGDPFTKTHVAHTIIADNTVLDVRRSKNTAPFANTFESGLYNVIGFGNALAAFQQDPSDQTEVANPLLGPLANNGGETFTHTLLPGSPAIDNGNPVLTGNSYAEQVLANSPVLYWKLDDKPGSEVVDAIGNTNGNVGAGVTLNRPGATLQTGKSVLFTGGAGNQIQSANPALSSSGFGDNYSISLWFNSSTTSAFQTLFEFVEDGTSNTEASLELLPGGVIRFSSEAETLAATTLYVANQWHNIVVVREGTDTHLYVDGLMSNTATLSGASINVDTFLFLGQSEAGTNPFSGFLDELVIYDSSLNSGDVQSLYFTAVSSVQPKFDQRGQPFSRVLDSDDNGTAIIDIGAVEVPAPAPNPDFNNDNQVDGSDFLAWQRGFGISSNASPGEGDSNNDGAVDGQDLINWINAYGFVGPTPSEAEEVIATPQQQIGVATTEVTISSAPTTTSLAPTLPSESLVHVQDSRLVELAARTPLFDAWGGGRPEKVLDVEVAPLFLFEVEKLTSAHTKFGTDRSGQSPVPREAEESYAATSSWDQAFERLEEFGLRGFDLDGVGT